MSLFLFELVGVKRAAAGADTRSDQGTFAAARYRADQGARTCGDSNIGSITVPAVKTRFLRCSMKTAGPVSIIVIFLRTDRGGQHRYHYHQHDGHHECCYIFVSHCSDFPLFLFSGDYCRT